MLEDQLLAAKFSEDLSYQSINLDNSKFIEIEKENDKLIIEIDHLKGLY